VKDNKKNMFEIQDKIYDLSSINEKLPYIFNVHSAAILLKTKPRDLTVTITFKNHPTTKLLKKYMKEKGSVPREINPKLQRLLAYNYSAIPKKSGGYRIIADPKPYIRYVQSSINTEILSKIPVHKIAIAYIHKEDNENMTWQQRISEVATGKTLIGTADISKFFDSINYHMVYDTLIKETGYNNEVCWLLTHLMTDLGHTPQGAITSPAISNIIMKEADEEVYQEFKKRGWDIVRYSDNYVFGKTVNIYEEKDYESYSIEDECQVPIDLLRNILSKYGFKMNEEKSWCTTNENHKPIMGMMFYVKPNAPKYIYNLLRWSVHNFVSKKEVPEVYKGNVNKYYRALLGKLNYWAKINPDRFTKTKEKLKEFKESLADKNIETAFEYTYVSKYNKFWNDIIHKQTKIEKKNNITQVA